MKLSFINIKNELKIIKIQNYYQINMKYYEINFYEHNRKTCEESFCFT